MRAEIDEKGKLRIYPDSETEQSALWSWCDGLKGDERSLVLSRIVAFGFDGFNTRVQKFTESAEVLERRKEEERLRKMEIEAMVRMDKYMSAAKARNSIADACTELVNKRDAAIRAAFNMLVAAIKDDIRKI